MATTPSPGIIRDDELYCIEQLTIIFNRPRNWVRDTFIRPVDPATRKRKRDKKGDLVPGVFHFKAGSFFAIPGSAIKAFVMENGGYFQDGEESDEND